MKRRSRILSLVFLSAALCACPCLAQDLEAFKARTMRQGPTDLKNRPIYGVAVADSMVKIPPRNPLLFKPSLADSISISLAGNESQGAQVVVFSPSAPLEAVTLEWSDLVGESGSISNRDIWAAPVGFVQTAKPDEYETPYVGWYPDPILTHVRQFEIALGDFQTIWYSVSAATDTPAGEYKGSLTISPANAPPHKVDVSVTVRPFSLPARPSLNTAVGLIQGAKTLYAFENPSHQRRVELEDAIDRFHARYRTNPPDIYRPWPPYPTEFARWKELGATSFNLAYLWDRRFDPATGEPEQKLQEEIARAYKQMKESGVEAAPYFYLYDEVDKSLWPQVKQVAAWVKKNYPDVPTLTTLLDKSYGLASGLDSIDAFCPIMHEYNLARARQARAKGVKVWWYVCAGPFKPYPNVFIEYPLIDTRLLLGFMSFAYEVDGFLYYKMSSPINNNKCISGGPYTDWNPASYQSSTGHKWNGDGHLWYPGPDGPVTSIRMENWRDGLEDYEYLVLARESTRRLNEAGGAQSAAKLQRQLDLWALPGQRIVKSQGNYATDPATISQALDEISRIIIQARRELNALKEQAK
ncbi:MAG: DUF4091 domain-containing protein [Planctomycetes bacterium]|jgi:hypothetical protein|nr:DUF4091 domain-containing protein [Planctomycetota bacterium]